MPAPARDDSLSRWAAALVTHVSNAADPALAMPLDEFASLDPARGALALENVTLGDLTRSLRRQVSAIDPRVFELGDVREVERQSMGEVWAKISRRGDGADGGRGGHGSGGGLESLSSLPTMNFLQLTAALAEEGAVGEANGGVGGRGARREAGDAGGRATRAGTKRARSTNGRASAGGKGTVAMMLVPTVPGVSYEPKKLKKRSNIPTPAERMALAPKKMGRRPKNAPQETEEEKKMRAEERLFRNRESAARSREKRVSAMKTLEDENARLRAENAALRTKLARYERAGQK